VLRTSVGTAVGARMGAHSTTLRRSR